MNGRAIICSIGFAIALVPAFAAPPQEPRRDQQPPTYRSGVTAVPIDVRVLDKGGKPIADLRREDFTVTEDGVPQAIAHFAASTLVAQAPRSELRARPETQPFSLASATAPQDYRVFLLVLGAGVLGDTSRYPGTRNALLGFIRQKLLPQDQVALLAGSRKPPAASGFTLDHERIARLIEMGLGASAPPASARGAPGPTPSADTDLGFEEYVKAWGEEPLSEIESLLCGINYLRFVEGEKHLVYVTVRGFDVPTWDDFNGIWNLKEAENWAHMKQLTRAANNARVALDTILLGERIIDIPIPRDMPAAPPARELPASADPEATATVRAGAGTGQTSRVAGDTIGLFDPLRSRVVFSGISPLAGAVGLFVDYDLRQTAQRTGGQSWMYGDASQALGRIDETTRTHYLLAYYPSNANWDGRTRDIKVTVNRPGATVLFRHSYVASPTVERFDRRRVITDSRIDAAGRRSADMRGVGVTVVPAFTKDAQGPAGTLAVPLSIDASTIAWGRAEDGRRTAHLEVAVYCGSSAKIIGQTRRQLNIALTDASYERVLKERFARELRLPLPGKPQYVKVIVYDADADRVGTILVKVK